ncbi:LytR C-terminal domain-containing protein [Couchioplanes caeruleus]|nr:LytR C-terminal domain-containing protein [Couchioplanes caeruleus]UQU68645.1 LytR C-terminal domain-containing protein [Couchioplanes caeruleus]
MNFARVRAVVLAGLLAVAAAVLVTVAVVRDSQAGAVAGGGCPDGAVRADVRLPDDNQQVTVRVYNGSRIPGLARSVSEDFRNRRFGTGRPAESRTKVDGVAVLRYGPDAVGRAWLVRAYFLDQADAQYDPRRKGPVVDVVVGAGFRQLATFTEVSQSLVALGEPELPPGACPAPRT